MYWHWVLSFYTNKPINRLCDYLYVCKAGRLALLEKKVANNFKNIYKVNAALTKLSVRDLSALHHCQAPLAFLIKAEVFWAWERTQWLRACTALTKDCSLIPTFSIQSSEPLVTPAPWDLTLPSRLHRYPHSCVQPPNTQRDFRNKLLK